MLALWNLITGWILTVIIVLGNGLVIYLIATRRRLRTTTNWFVLSLAIADLGVGILLFPRFSLCNMDKKTCAQNKTYDSVAFCATLFFFLSSQNSLCVLTLDRYLAIDKPMIYNTVFMQKPKRVTLLIFAAWILTIPILGPCMAFKFVGSKQTSFLSAKGMWTALGVVQLLACLFLVFCTAKVVLAAKRITRQDATIAAQLAFNYDSRERKTPSSGEGTAAKLVGMIVVFFVMSSAVDIFLTLTKRYPWWNLPHATLNLLFAVGRLLKLTNSAVNPLVYALYKNDIWRELRGTKRSSTSELAQFPLECIEERPNEWDRTSGRTEWRHWVF